MFLSSPIPLNAFINSYKIIGAKKGLEKKDLEDYVKNRLTLSIKRTNYLFDIKNCNSCFAKAYKKGVTVKR